MLTPHTQELWHRLGGTAPECMITASLHYAPARIPEAEGRLRQVLRGVWGQSSSTLQRTCPHSPGDLYMVCFCTVRIGSCETSKGMVDIVEGHRTWAPTT